MKAITYTRFGPPEVLQIRELEKPTPQDSEVLIRIHATTVEREDPGMRSSPGFNGLIRPKNPILGAELAGTIEAVGTAVTRFHRGDRVFGNTGMRLGTYAEYTCVPETGALAFLPDGTSFVEGAALTNGVLTALPFLRDLGGVGRGQRVLVYGASGSVGTAAVQLARAFGARVTGVCGTANQDLVRSLGAERVVDYTGEGFSIESLSRQDSSREGLPRSGELYDIVFDTVGKISFSRSKHLLKPDGIYLATVPSPAILVQWLWTSRFGGRKVRFAATGLRPPALKAGDLAFLQELLERGKIKAVIDRTYPPERIADAHRYVADGHKRGSVVIDWGEGS